MTHDATAQPTPTDATQPIQVTVGADFTIVLAANHTTGYSWELVSTHHPGVRRVRMAYREAAHAPGMVGVGGWEIWTFHAQSRYRTTLTFHYRRPWEASAPPAETATFTVISQ